MCSVSVRGLFGGWSGWCGGVEPLIMRVLGGFGTLLGFEGSHSFVASFVCLVSCVGAGWVLVGWCVDSWIVDASILDTTCASCVASPGRVVCGVCLCGLLFLLSVCETSYEGHMVDALASRADEGRTSLR